ncbi:MAG: hypothetical protein LBJ24_04350, partial [Treponema sp.]|nr:hypothetical protein [Treponema sp.]
GIALWDVLAECDISGASDTSIRNPVVNDFGAIFAAAPVRAVLITGRTAYRLYERLCSARYDVPFFYLPSPSPANCAMGMEQITGSYRELLLRFLDKVPAAAWKTAPSADHSENHGETVPVPSPGSRSGTAR